MVFYPVRGSPIGIGLYLRNLIGYLRASFFGKDGGQVICEF